jgi:hypothetical protein
MEAALSGDGCGFIQRTSRQNLRPVSNNCLKDRSDPVKVKLMKTIYKVVSGGLVLGLIAASVPQAQAGDKEWAVAGKVLTGIAAASVIHNALTPKVQTTYVYHTQPVVVQQTPVVVQQTPVVVQQTQPCVQPAPVVVQQPVYYQVVQPAPVVVYHSPPPVVYRTHVVHRRHRHFGW